MDERTVTRSTGELCRFCHHAADHIDARDGCDDCNEAAQLGSYAPCVGSDQLATTRREYLAALDESLDFLAAHPEYHVGPDGRLAATCDPGDHRPNADGTACRWCGLPAEPDDPDALADALTVGLRARGAITEEA